MGKARIRGKLNAGDFVPYVVVQVAGAAVAALAVNYFHKGMDPLTAMVPFRGPALVAEFLFPFALVFVVLNSATAEGTSGNSFYGLAIGFTVLVGAVSVGAISGGAFNPAVVLGGAAMGLFAWSTLIYLVPQLIAGVAAGLVFRALNPTDD